MALSRAPGGDARPLSAPARARQKFLHHFPGGFHDETYLDWERDYKMEVHRAWQATLGPAEYARLLDAGAFGEIAARAVRVEQGARHSMLFSFEKMALRDAVRPPQGARAFAEGLDALLHGKGALGPRFDAWCDVVASLPRRQTRVLTWPTVTVFAAMAQPRRHLFVKPKAMREAARAYGFDLPYRARPDWATYARFLDLARTVRRDLADLRPRDLVDVQSFLWVLGSDEY